MLGMVANVVQLRGVIHPMRLKWKNAHHKALLARTSRPHPEIAGAVPLVRLPERRPPCRRSAAASPDIILHRAIAGTGSGGGADR
jgi:hypothetical protein